MGRLHGYQIHLSQHSIESYIGEGVTHSLLLFLSLLYLRVLAVKLERLGHDLRRSCLGARSGAAPTPTFPVALSPRAAPVAFDGIVIAQTAFAVFLAAPTKGGLGEGST